VATLLVIVLNDIVKGYIMKARIKTACEDMKKSYEMLETSMIQGLMGFANQQRMNMNGVLKELDDGELLEVYHYADEQEEDYIHMVIEEIEERTIILGENNKQIGE